MNLLPTVFVVGAEFILGYYSQLVKVVPVNLHTHVLARMACYFFASLLFGSLTNRLSFPSPSHLLTMGTLNITHIYSSYYAFQRLPSATSLSLFFTYPFFNLLFASFLLGEKLNVQTLPWLALSFVGALFVMFPVANEANHNKKIDLTGLSSIILSAITESLIYISFRSKYEKSEFQGVFDLYGGGLIGILLARFLNIIEPFNFSINTAVPLVLFNTFVGFIATSTIFNSIAKLSVEVFASLAFFGVLSGFVFGELGGDVRPTIPTYIGATAITTAAIVIRLMKKN